jgi:protoporphyrinogen oxidase
MGGHRFFTKSQEVQRFWLDVLANDFLRRPRLSRIYYKKKFFFYPLKPVNALLGLGVVESVQILLSYLRWQLSPYPQEDTFEQWVTNRFGQKLYQTFFKTYTEKVWGIPCSELKAEWAAQRIKDLSLRTALVSMFMKPKNTIKTLIEEFDYPRLGPGMMWHTVQSLVEQGGGEVWLKSEVVSFRREGDRLTSLRLSQGGEERTVVGESFISSMSIAEFIQKLDPAPSSPVLQSAAKLSYRDFLTVCLIINQPDLFPDNWVYVHDPDVRVGRIQNFKNWSPEMVPDPTKTSLGLEYFCTEGDDLWMMPDRDLVELGKREVERIGLARSQDVEDGCVFRVSKSYPIYDSDYMDHLAVVRRFVEGLENFQTIGRNGLHRYNNQDHAMLTGMLAVRNLLNGERNDLWSVNADQEYLEEIRDETVVEQVLSEAFPKLDRVALGLAVGIVGGLLLSVATLWLFARSIGNIGQTLGLLRQFFPGYWVSPRGIMLGIVYGFISGFIIGWLYAFLRNAAVFFYMATIHHRAERYHLRRFLEYL